MIGIGVRDVIFRRVKNIFIKGGLEVVGVIWYKYFYVIGGNKKICSIG